MKRYNRILLWAAIITAAVIGGHVFPSKAPAGSLEPAAPPAKSMHTLEEIYENTAGVLVPTEALATPRGSVFMNVDGIQGEATETSHRAWIEIFAYSHSMESSAIFYPRPGPAEVQMEPLIVVKQLDKASPHLALKCCDGSFIKEVRIEWLSNNPESYSLSLRVTLQDVTVSRVTPRLVHRRDSFVLIEEVAFVFAKIRWEYWGAKGINVTEGWNVAEQKPL